MASPGASGSIPSLDRLPGYGGNPPPPETPYNASQALRPCQEAHTPRLQRSSVLPPIRQQDPLDLLKHT